MTKLISEVEYLRFKEKLRSIIILTIIGFIIGFFFGYAGDNNILNGLMMGALFAGMPYAWSVIPVFVFFSLGAIVIKFFVALIFGWIITPIVLTYNIIQMKRYEKAVRENIMAEQREKEANIRRENENVQMLANTIQTESGKIQQAINRGNGFN